jgi:hypothetical protein
VNIFDILALMVLLPAGVYALAILLRVACYYRGVEIPALGRALFTAFITAALSLTAGGFFQLAIVGPDPVRLNLFAQFLALFLALSTHVMITIGLYVPLLDLRLGQAFSVWLAQAVTFVAFGMLFGSCVALPLIIF